jgi:hypothetical protein
MEKKNKDAGADATHKPPATKPSFGKAAGKKDAEPAKPPVTQNPASPKPKPTPQVIQGQPQQQQPQQRPPQPNSTGLCF